MTAVEFAASKVAEELEEVRRELEAGERSRLEDELGDLLIASAGLASTLDVNPESALRGALAKFETRLRHVEAGLRDEARELADADSDQIAARWAQAKQG